MFLRKFLFFSKEVRFSIEILVHALKSEGLIRYFLMLGFERRRTMVLVRSDGRLGGLLFDSGIELFY